MTGKGWTDAEEQTFAEIMRIGRMARMDAIRLYRRCRSDAAKALRLAEEHYGMSDTQAAAYEQSKAVRLAGLAVARQRRAQNRLSQQRKGGVLGAKSPEMAFHTEGIE